MTFLGFEALCLFPSPRLGDDLVVKKRNPRSSIVELSLDCRFHDERTWLPSSSSSHSAYHHINLYGAPNFWALSRSIAGDNERHDSTCIFHKGGLVTNSYTE
jgi:hypothetical protein